MAYPEPIPRLNTKQTEEFRQRFDQFRLSQDQRQMYSRLLRELAAARRSH